MTRHPHSKKTKPAAQKETRSSCPVVFSILLGAFFGLCLLKFSNPAIMEKYVQAPTTIIEALAGTLSWPIAWGYRCLLFLGFILTVTLFLSQSFRSSVRQTFSPLASAPARLDARHLAVVLPLLWLF